jgi:tetratricopeptide (TPR) repeat protein
VTKITWPWSRRALPQGPIDPSSLIPVTAEDVARRKRRIALAWLGAAAVVALAVFWIHQRSTDPLKAQAALEAGQQLMTAARYSQAIFNFDRAIALKSDFAEAWRMRGRAHLALNETNSAIEDFTRTVRLQPRERGVLLERGQAYLAEKDYRSAIADGGCQESG